MAVQILRFPSEKAGAFVGSLGRGKGAVMRKGVGLGGAGELGGRSGVGVGVGVRVPGLGLQAASFPLQARRSPRTQELPGQGHCAPRWDVCSESSAMMHSEARKPRDPPPPIPGQG